MADNTTLPGSGDVVRDIDRGTAKTQVMQIDAGGVASESLVSLTNPLPVTDSNLNSAQANNLPLSVTVVGAPDGDLAGVSLLEQAIDDTSGVGFNVKVLNPPKTDANGRQMVSDAPAPIYFNPMAVGQSIIIDSSGYSSVVFHSLSTYTGTFSNSIDGGVYVGDTSAIAPNNLMFLPSNAIAAGALRQSAVSGRFIKCTATAIGTLVIQLRSALVPYSVVALGGASGNSLNNGGIAGSIGIGGNVAANAATAYFPVQIAGSDSGTIGVNAGAATVRRLLTDNQGRVRLAEEGVVQDQRAPFVNVQISQQGFDGQSITDLLSQMLLEMKIHNQYLFAFLSQSSEPASEPDNFRNTPEMFN